jgi:hypothetical protein
MEQARKILSVVAAAGLILAATPMLWAGSAVPPDTDPAYFLGDFKALVFDPNAPGTKYSGKLTVAYEAAPLPEGASCDFSFYRNMYVVLTLQKGTQNVPFVTQYRDALNATDGFCGLDGEMNTQAQVIVDLIEHKVKLQFCPECTEFAKIKSISNLQYVQPGTPLSSPNSGGFSADITVALR